MNRKNAILLNDTSKESHIGCSQVINNIRKVCEFNGIHIAHTFTRQQIVKDSKFSSIIKSVDLISVK